MYVIKNALKSISRSKGRNLLIGVIVFVIALSACLGFSIRQAAKQACDQVLDGMTITATIDFDRQSFMSDMRGGGEKWVDKAQFSTMMGSYSGLTLEAYQTYAKAPSVSSFYYTQTVSLDGSEDLVPISTSMDGGDVRGKMMNGGSQGDFQIIGYSDEQAMTAFQNGQAIISEGTVFEEGTSEMVCLVSAELAAYNDLAVGSTITLVNPLQTTETYELTITGIYTDSSANQSVFGMKTSDPANQIYMSAAALDQVLLASNNQAVDVTDENSGMTLNSALNASLSGIYVFQDVAAFEQFQSDVREMGLDEMYTVSSMDLNAFENSLQPLNTLSNMAGYFLVVILLIGAVILVVLHVFQIRERKYEIGVLMAMGMNRIKVACQFLTEIFVVTLIAAGMGLGVGAVSSVPVTNALLANQIASETANQQQIEANFGRGNKMENPLNNNNSPVAVVSSVSEATNAVVMVEMMAVTVFLTLVSGAVSISFIMRYEPLKILSNRD